MSVFSFLKTTVAGAAAERPQSFADGIALAQNTPGAVLLDVRTPQEYAGGHIPG
ncbi:MAG: rhodanese-like domain-containing protein, partial [Ruthenibacterium sp.]